MESEESKQETSTGLFSLILAFVVGVALMFAVMNVVVVEQQQEYDALNESLAECKLNLSDAQDQLGILEEMNDVSSEAVCNYADITDRFIDELWDSYYSHSIMASELSQAELMNERVREAWC